MKKHSISNMRKAVCTMANELRKKGFSLSQAFKKAWRRVKECMTLRVAGTTFNKGQNKLAYLAQFKPEALRVILERDAANEYDSSAVKVLVQVPEIGKQAYIGYVPAAISKEVAQMIDTGVEIEADPLGVVGGYGYKEHYGFLLRLAI